MQEAKERELKERQLLEKQEKLIKATRKAMQLASPYTGNLEDIKQVMDNFRMSGPISKKPSISYDEKVNKLQQEEYKDEYEGFGSLTEMIKNKDKIAEKQANEEI